MYAVETYRVKLSRVFLNSLGVKNLAVVLANLEVLVVMLSEHDLLLIVSQLQVCCVILLLLRYFFTSSLLLFALLLLLLELLRSLLRLAGQVSRADLTSKNTSLCPVSALNAERYLCEDEFRLFSAVHGTKGLDLQLAKNFGSSLQIALLFLDVREDLGNSRTLYFNKDLALCYCSQRLDNRKFRLQIGRFVKEAHYSLDHFRDCLLQLAVLLGQDQGLLVHQAPIAGIFADRDDGN